LHLPLLVIYTVRKLFPLLLVLSILIFSSLVGHARTFWIAQERARQYNGKLLLRIEDIDIQRCKMHYLPDMIEDLNWFGIDCEEGYRESEEQNKEDGESFVQSKRFPLYIQAWKILYDKGYIYPCKQSRRDVDAALSAPHDNFNPTDIHETRKKKPRASSGGERSLEIQQMIGQIPNEAIFPSFLRPSYLQNIPYEHKQPIHSFLPEEFRNLQSPLDVKVNWRFRVPDDFRSVSFIDGQFGEQSFIPGEDFGDFLVWRLDGYPSYELAVVVDDILMGITEVVRGQDLLISTARQLLLMKAIFGLDYKESSQWHPHPSALLNVTPTLEENEEELEEEEGEVEEKDESNEKEELPSLSFKEEQGWEKNDDNTSDVVVTDQRKEQSHEEENNATDQKNQNNNSHNNNSSSSAANPPPLEALFHNPTNESSSSRRYRIPVYHHLPLVCDENGQRLAKRNMAKSLRKLREEGFTPEQLREKHAISKA
jgi:glutamyl-tRNA synthetase